MSKFCTVVNCMDGRVQLPVIRFLQERFGVEYVDSVTEPGPNGILAARTAEDLVASIERRIAISVEKHDSVGIAVVGHDDCAGNPVSPEEQEKQTAEAVRYIRSKFGSVPVIGLWLDKSWTVSETK